MLFKLILVALAATLVQTDPIITPGILDSFRSYSYSVLLDKYTRKGSDEVGASGFSTLGLGQLLAVINEKVWEVDTYGFDNALKTPKTKILDYYTRILGALSQDDRVTLYSNIYTSRRDLLAPPALAALKTDVTFVDYNSTTETVNSAVGEINARIAVQTFGKIFGTLVPEGGWWGLPFFNYTQGILTNTFYYRASIANALRKTFEAKFSDGEKVTFLETKGIPLSTHSDTYQGVRIPFKNSSKSLVLILPAGNVSDFVKRDLEAHLRKTDFDTKAERTIRVQIPKMNFTIPTSFFKQLKKFGVTESMCRYDKNTRNTFESPVQNVHINLDENLDFQVASATGTHVNNVESFISIHEQTPEKQQQQQQADDPEQPDPEDNAENLDILSRMKSDLFSDSDFVSKKLPNKSILARSEEDMEPDQKPPRTAAINRQAVLTFNRPFFYYLDDPVLGPVFYGSVQSFKEYRKHEDDVPAPGFEWQHEALKYLFWSCP